MLYSLDAMTTYGHESVSLEAHWQLMGALEALNGLTTAFLFAMFQEVWQIHRRRSAKAVLAVRAGHTAPRGAPRHAGVTGWRSWTANYGPSS